jgi:hypothetical protein
MPVYADPRNDWCNDPRNDQHSDSRNNPQAQPSLSTGTRSWSRDHHSPLFSLQVINTAATP